MKRTVAIGVVLALACAGTALAAREEKKPQAASQAASQNTKEREALATSIINLQTQVLRVNVLQQLLNEEAAKLRTTEAAFAKQNKLDVEKLRQGLYVFDAQQGKVIEQTAPAAAAPAEQRR
jgi:hypothetical protein